MAVVEHQKVKLNLETSKETKKFAIFITVVTSKDHGKQKDYLEGANSMLKLNLFFVETLACEIFGASVTVLLFTLACKRIAKRGQPIVRCL